MECKKKPKQPSLRTRALGYLSRREYSRAELFRKLLPYAKKAYYSEYDLPSPSSALDAETESFSNADMALDAMPESIERQLCALLDELEQKGFLCDQRFAESLLHRRAQLLGSHRILNELKQHHLDPSLLEQAKEQLHSNESARLHAVWQKKYGHPPTTFQERQKQARFLASRGFSHAAITALLGDLVQE